MSLYEAIGRERCRTSDGRRRLLELSADCMCTGHRRKWGRRIEKVKKKEEGRTQENLTNFAPTVGKR